MLSRSFARRTVSSILIRESRTTVFCCPFRSNTTNIRSDVLKRVRTHNHPVTTENKASRKGDKSFPDIRLRNIASGKVDGNIPVKPTFGPAFDVLQKREFSIQRIKKITGKTRNKSLYQRKRTAFHDSSSTFSTQTLVGTTKKHTRSISLVSLSKERSGRWSCYSNILKVCSFVIDTVHDTSF